MVDLAKLDESVADMATFDARVQKHLEALDRVIALAHRSSEALPLAAQAFKTELLEHLTSFGGAGDDLELV